MIEHGFPVGQALLEEDPRQHHVRRRVIIVAPHFPPSNLASVHRSRLLAHHLREFGWEPIIVTVAPGYYEEDLDWELTKLLSSDLRVERVSALPTRPIRFVGDVGIRGFVPMLRRIVQLIDEEAVGFLYITIPSFFAAPLGRLVHALRGIPYGIDYIDPWVHRWPGSERALTKAWWSQKLAEWLEPFAVRRASLITGVTDRSYSPVFDRNPHLHKTAVRATMPYGGEMSDHLWVRQTQRVPYLFEDDNRFRVVYAGTMWDAAEQPLGAVFRSIAAHQEVFEDVRFEFIGTGGSPIMPRAQVLPLASTAGITNGVVVEHPRRIPYTDVLTHLEAGDAVFIFGGIQPHYTPSKLYQAVLSGKPVLAVLHAESPACEALRQTSAGRVITFRGVDDLSALERCFADEFLEFREFATRFDPSSVNLGCLEQHSARAVSRTLAKAMDCVLARCSRSREVRA